MSGSYSRFVEGALDYYKPTMSAGNLAHGYALEVHPVMTACHARSKAQSPEEAAEVNEDDRETDQYDTNADEDAGEVDAYDTDVNEAVGEVVGCDTAVNEDVNEDAREGDEYDADVEDGSDIDEYGADVYRDGPDGAEGDGDAADIAEEIVYEEVAESHWAFGDRLFVESGDESDVRSEVASGNLIDNIDDFPEIEGFSRPKVPPRRATRAAPKKMAGASPITSTIAESPTGNVMACTPNPYKASKYRMVPRIPGSDSEEEIPAKPTVKRSGSRKKSNTVRGAAAMQTLPTLYEGLVAGSAEVKSPTAPSGELATALSGEFPTAPSGDIATLAPRDPNPSSIKNHIIKSKKTTKTWEMREERETFMENLGVAFVQHFKETLNGSEGEFPWPAIETPLPGQSGEDIEEAEPPLRVGGIKRLLQEMDGCDDHDATAGSEQRIKRGKHSASIDVIAGSQEN